MTACITFEKDKGQHILQSSAVLRAIVEKAGVKPTDIVLEIGPGTGNLTMGLLERAKKVIAYEIDPRMVAELQKRVARTPLKGKLQIHVGDVIKAEQLPYFDVCVANLPYQISSPFIFKLVRHRNFRSATLMVQKEFGDRLVASSGDKVYSRLTAAVQLYCKASHLMKVDRKNFKPPPKVDSSVIRIEPRHPPPPVEFSEWDHLLRIVFSRKNRTLLALFKHSKTMQQLEKNWKDLAKRRPVKKLESGSFPAYVLRVLTEGGFAARRARTMDEDDLLRLLLTLKKKNIFL